jgi:hypothetical protein
MSEPDRTKLPIRRPPFQGVSNRTLAGSEPDWNLIGHPEPPEGSPNVDRPMGPLLCTTSKG